ncbi:hypothetical protein M8C21_014281 [Ambrosia artemisiifolia]|uniref:Uncharacterized protein n=1 Tax=Ambrosia artemisiifolia TaxID=4212 RepID=A0AAD5C5N8_AMBAR|nr:hypothetical protein M8C21_014281 [Ambrosia artemisiifolia]
MLLQIAHECLDMHKRKVDHATRLRAHLLEALADAKLELTILLTLRGEKLFVGSGGQLFDKNGFPKSQMTNGWRGRDGLYAAGFTRRGLAGVSADAMKIPQDIGTVWNQELNHLNKGGSYS